MAGDPQRILILGGTAQARDLAKRLATDDRYFPLTSLAGLTSAPEAIEGETRTGGFGGAAGLARFIEERGIALVVDAAHPFACRISMDAVEACSSTGVPCLRLERPAWEAQDGDDWTIVPDVRAAAFAIPPEARALVTVGRTEVAAFFERDDVSILARMIERPPEASPKHVEVLLSRPPYTLGQELTLMRARDISVLVTKNSGGDATYPKIEAARELELPVIMIERPGKPAVPMAETVDALLPMIEEHMA